jgi:RNAse (barnase) inhibitor barstar
MTHMSDFVWYRHEFPWIGYGFIPAVHADAEPDFRSRLTELRVEVFDMVGSPDRSVHEQLKEAYSFPDYTGRNWDAFSDVMGDLSLPHRSALFWHDADVYATSDPKLFAEACAMITSTFDAIAVVEGKQATLVLLGRGVAFKRPE